ncbi:MAG: hypothetical protein ACTSUO_05280 [Candidatus Thorarchaeota archaeon]
MPLDPQILVGVNDDSIQLVKGCPCYRQIGEEHICMNNDDVLPISSIVVDPKLFASLPSVHDLDEFKSDRNDMCYLLINLNKNDGLVYCISRAQVLKINNRAIRVEDILDALHFVPVTGREEDGVVCSSCLYKYLVTLSHVFTEVVTEVERNEIVFDYVKDIAFQIAQEVKISTNSSAIKKNTDVIQDYIEDLMEDKAKWAGIIFDLKQREFNETVLNLLDNYRLLSRLQAVFMFQILALMTEYEEESAQEMLQLIAEVTNRVVITNDYITDKQTELFNRGLISEEIRGLIMKHAGHRRITHLQFQNLRSVLHQIETLHA